MKNLLKNEFGVSLVQVMVAFGLMGALGLAVMRMNSENLKASKRVESKGEIDGLHREILSYLSNDIACTYTFGGANADLSAFKSSGAMAITAIKNDSNLTKFSVGFNRMGVEIININVKNYNSSDDTASFQVEYKYKIGTTEMKRTRPFNVSFDFDDTNPNLLKRCIARSGTTNVDPKEICDMVVGFDKFGQSYFDGATCQFAQASCEKSKGIWNTTTSECDLSDSQKLKVRIEACNAEGGLLVKPVKAWHYKLSGHMNDTTPCTSSDMGPNKCYCKTKWSKYYRDYGTVAGTFPQEQSIPLERMQQVGGYFTIEEHFPADVGANIASASDKKRLVKVSATSTIQYILPYTEYSNPSVTGNPWMLEPNSTPFILVDFDLQCYSSNSIGVGGTPWSWDIKPNLSNSNWPWSQGGNTYSTGYHFLGRFAAGGFGFDNTFNKNRPLQAKRIYAALKDASNYVDWRNQYNISAETYALLEPGDKCVATIKPVYSSDHSKTNFVIRFGRFSLAIDQYSNLMDIPVSDG